MDEKLRPPPPISIKEKMGRIHCSASTALNWGRGASISHFILSKITPGDGKMRDPGNEVVRPPI